LIGESKSRGLYRGPLSAARSAVDFYRSRPRSIRFRYAFSACHRGQAHALLTSIIGNDRTPSFDLIIYQRETGQGGLRKIG
jgi:hypothetical protein